MTWRDNTEQLLGIATRTFGHNTAIVYTPQVGTPVTFGLAGGPFAVFDAEFQLVEVGDSDLGPVSTAPVLGVRLSDFPQAPLNGDTYVVDGQKYRVTEVQPDGEGGALLLSKKSA